MNRTLADDADTCVGPCYHPAYGYVRVSVLGLKLFIDGVDGNAGTGR